MPLPDYGLLVGSIDSFSPQVGGNPHYQLEIRSASSLYRVAVNVESTEGSGVASELLVQIIKNFGANGNAKIIVDGCTSSVDKGFAVLDMDSDLRLDFVHGGIVDMTQFNTAEAIGPIDQELQQIAQTVQANKGWVAAFGTGFPPNGSNGSGNAQHQSSGFQGVDNIHMNQGSFQYVGDPASQAHYKENGPKQDGGLLFFDGTSITAFFSKFSSQDDETNASGLPIHTGVQPPPQSVEEAAAGAPTVKFISPSKPSRPKPEVVNRVMTAMALPGAGNGVGTKNDFGFVFADPPGFDDPVRPFQPDDDSSVDQKYVNQFAAQGVPEPVPAPRGGQYPTMDLASILGSPAVAQITAAGKITFHCPGDSGAPTAQRLRNEMMVTDLMAKDFVGGPGDKPAFAFHVGDVVYFFGEQNYYYDQFFEPFKDYPAPIFAIPGNHDGITYDASMVSLAAFQAAFCDSAPNQWPGAGGVARTTMTQPGVYFTLNCPFISIIGLYSNCGESLGYLDDAQKAFLESELKRLKPLRDAGTIKAILLAVHHPPLSFSKSKPSSVDLRQDIDDACEAADCYPDAVVSGHAHLYQRMTRTMTIDGKTWQVPYLIGGSSGYNATAKEEVNKDEFTQLDQSDPEFILHRVFVNYGYLWLQLDSNANTLRVEFRSPQINSGNVAADVCILNLGSHSITS